jgi:hypothetical protein
MLHRRLVKPLVVVAISSGAGAAAWAVTCGTQLSGQGGGISCPGGNISLVQTYCLGVTWSECNLGWFNDIVIKNESGGTLSGVYVGAAEGESSNVDFAKVRFDTSETWDSIWNEDMGAFSIGAGQTKTFHFWSRATGTGGTNPSNNGRLVVWIYDGTQRRYFGWMNIKEPSGASCPDSSCP